MKNFLLSILFFAFVAIGYGQNDFSVDASFTYVPNIDQEGRYLEAMPNGCVALIDTNTVTVIDATGLVTHNVLAMCSADLDKLLH